MENATKIKLANLTNPEKSFPIYSMCGTLGWLSAGVMVSAMGLDTSADAGRIGAFIRVLLGMVCFLLPTTVPEDTAGRRGLKAALGLEAFVILKNKQLRVFYIASTVITIPYMAHFMYAPLMLKAFGSEYPTGQMTIGQFMELFAMLLLSMIAGRYRIRSLLILSMLFGVARFLLFALSGAIGSLPVIWLGIALHGPIYTFMTVSGRIFVDRRVPARIRGQAQALYSLLTINIAGILGSFCCEIVYQNTLSTTDNDWVGFWLIMAGFAVIPLIYFVTGFSERTSNPAKQEILNVEF